MHQRPSICTVIIGIVMFISGSIAITLEFIDDDAETGLLGLILGMSICGTGMVLFTGGLTWLCCQKPQNLAEIVSNKAASLSNSMKKSPDGDLEANYRNSKFIAPVEIKTLDPRTEDPVARRAVTNLVFKDCPDDFIMKIDPKVKKEEVLKPVSPVTSVEEFPKKSTRSSRKKNPPLQKQASILHGTSFYNENTSDFSLPSSPEIIPRPPSISEVQKSKIHESALENGEIKLILYRERKRQLEEELRRRLHREAIYQELIRSEYLTLQSPYRTRTIEPEYSPQLSSRSLDRGFYRTNAPKMSSSVHVPYGKPVHISEMKFTHAYIPKI